MLIRHSFCLALGCLAMACSSLAVSTVQAAEKPYTQTQNIVYAETAGIGLVLDVFTPTGTPNGLAIIDVVSSTWESDRGKIEQHRKAGFYDVFCGRGYTVFAIRPGSKGKFTLSEMAKHVKQGIAWVKEHAAEYNVNPDKIGLAGASAGGHLASLVAVTADDASRVQAVGVFFPPTNFLNYRGIKIEKDSPPQNLFIVKALLYPNGNAPKDMSKLITELTAISPALLVTDQAPPFLLIHGDADPLVPLDQSEMLKKALEDCGRHCELIVKKGGAHPWPTIREEVVVIADWFDKQLADK